jgi:hypothetical protein
MRGATIHTFLADHDRIMGECWPQLLDELDAAFGNEAIPRAWLSVEALEARGDTSPFDSRAVDIALNSTP